MPDTGIELIARGHHQQRGGDEIGVGAVDAVGETDRRGSIKFLCRRLEWRYTGNKKRENGY